MASLLIETHRWRGFSAARDMFFAAFFVCGFITLGLYHGSLSERLRRLLNLLKKGGGE